VGKMFPNMSAKYISAEGKELGPGEPGELWLKGPNVFKGYWKKPDATRDAITEDGYFKTGDVGFQDKDHNFYITDRVKELIKYKGFQVAPAGELKYFKKNCAFANEKSRDANVFVLPDRTRGHPDGQPKYQ
jgi:long-subunit acyl-CoA synthetase (AMP-forming)